MNASYIAALLNSVLRTATPIMFATLACAICSKVNVFNIALEGQMLVATFAAIATNYYTHSVLLCILAGMISGGLVGFLVAVFQVKWKAKDMVVGTSLNLLITALTAYLLYTMFNQRGTFRDEALVSLPKVPISFGEKAVFLNRVFESLNIMDIVVYAVAVLIFIFLYKTVPGYHVLSVGINKTATISMGTKADLIQVLVVTFSGSLCGLCGVALCMGNITMFTESMTAGRGYMAMAASSLVGAHPLGCILASLFFGAAVASEKVLQNYINGQITSAFPYLATFVIMSISGLIRTRKAQRK